MNLLCFVLAPIKAGLFIIKYPFVKTPSQTVPDLITISKQKIINCSPDLSSINFTDKNNLIHLLKMRYLQGQYVYNEQEAWILYLKNSIQKFEAAVF